MIYSADYSFLVDIRLSVTVGDDCGRHNPGPYIKFPCCVSDMRAIPPTISPSTLFDWDTCSDVLGWMTYTEMISLS